MPRERDPWSGRRDDPPEPARSAGMDDTSPRTPRDLDLADEAPAVAEPVEAEGDDEPVTVGELIEGARGAANEVGQVMAGAASDLAGSARRLFDQGRYRKVRISRKGKPVLPDIPIAAAAAVQAASMYGGGIARVLAANLGAKLLFDVDIVNEADKYLAKAHTCLLDGDVVRAREALITARRMDDRHAGVELLFGVIARLEGDPARARAHLERAKALDPLGDSGKRAESILASLEGARGP